MNFHLTHFPPLICIVWRVLVLYWGLLLANSVWASQVPTITKTANGTTFAAGSTITYTIVVCAGSTVNTGVITDVLDPQLNPATVVSSDFTVSGATLTSAAFSL